MSIFFAFSPRVSSGYFLVEVAHFYKKWAYFYRILRDWSIFDATHLSKMSNLLRGNICSSILDASIDHTSGLVELGHPARFI